VLSPGLSFGFHTPGRGLSLPIEIPSFSAMRATPQPCAMRQLIQRGRGGLGKWRLSLAA